MGLLHQCSEALDAHPYLVTEESTYEPPADPDSGLSLEELGLRALERIPRDRAIDGIQAFMDLRFVSVATHNFSCSYLTSVFR